MPVAFDCPACGAAFVVESPTPPRRGMAGIDTSLFGSMSGKNSTVVPALPARI